VEFHKRWDATNLWIRKALNEKKLGKLLYFTVDLQPEDHHSTYHLQGMSDRTNIFQYLSVHYVDLIWFLTRFKPIRCMAVGMEGILKQQGNKYLGFGACHHPLARPDNQDDRFVSQFATNWIDPACTSAMSDQK